MCAAGLLLGKQGRGAAMGGVIGMLQARAEARKAARREAQAKRDGSFGSAVEILLNRARVAQNSTPTAPTAPSTMLSPLGGNTLG